MTTWACDLVDDHFAIAHGQAQPQGAALIARRQRDRRQHAGDILGLPQHFIECDLGSLAANRRDVDLAHRGAPFGREPLDGRGSRDDLARLGLAGHAIGGVHAGAEHIARLEHDGTKVAADADRHRLALHLEFGVRGDLLLHLTRRR